MDENGPGRTDWPRRFLPVLIVVALAMRAHHFQAPALDQLHVKQIFIANRARSIARSTSSALWGNFDFLDENGERMTMVEEVPLYTLLVGLSYRAFGEHEWLGRAWNLLAVCAAMLALFDLVRRELDDEAALIATFLFGFSPLAIFYGRAISPDPWMIACVLLCAAAFRRYLDEGMRWGDWAAAAAFGVLASAFKYYGLVVLFPLAEMARRQKGWRAWFRPWFLGLAAVMVLPISVWVIAVFARHPNPLPRSSYFCFQAPWILLHERFFRRLTLGLFVNDFGPVTTVLIAIGAWAAARGRAAAARWLWGWTALGAGFILLFAPKFLDHDYYALLALPAAAGWGAVGWRHARGLINPAAPPRLARIAGALAVAALVQSPWVMPVKFEMENQHAVVAAGIRRHCPPSARVVVMGQGTGWSTVHYSGRLGWVEQSLRLPGDWRARLRRHRDQGGVLAAIYFDPSVPEAARRSYGPMLSALPVIEHGAGPWFRRGLPCEYYLLDLARLDEAAAPGRAPEGVAAAGPDGQRTR